MWQSPTVWSRKPWGCWVNKWRKTHSGIEGEEMTATQLAEYKKIKAELREARTGD